MTAPKEEHSSALLAAFHRYLGEQKLKSTKQRERIVEAFDGSHGHLSVDDLLLKVRVSEANIGYATVYRTLKLLVDAGLASERHFGDGFTRFEPKGEDHHDHMICEKCGRILEFHDEELETLQEVIARRHGFKLTRHRHEFYGLCENCRG